MDALKLGYTWLKCGIAVEMLAAKPGTLQERVFVAFRELHVLQETDFPDDVRDTYVELRNELNRCDPTGREGRATATIRQMTGASRAALLIVGLADRVTVLYTQARIQEGLGPKWRPLPSAPSEN
jgi:hypothetical protein